MTENYSVDSSTVAWDKVLNGTEQRERVKTAFENRESDPDSGHQS